jgi:Calcium binding
MRRKNERNAANLKTRKAPWPPSKRRLQELVDDAIVDAYGEAEQRTGFFTMIEDHLALPFDTEVLGVMVTVERIDLTEADEIVVVCRRNDNHQSIPMLDLPLPQPPPAGAEWIEAYRYWMRGA